MLRISGLRIVALGLLFILRIVPNVGQAGDPPSILFILTDDLSFDSVAGLGNREVQTPNIDRLIKEGTTFTHCYSMGAWNGAVCVSSRTMLNTGYPLWKSPQKADDFQKVIASGGMWSQQLKAAGYQTQMAGKWYLPIKPETVFDEVRNPRGGMPPDSKQYDRPKAGEPDTWDPSDPQFGGYWTGGKHWSEVTADDTIALLKESATRKQPFFLYSAFNAAHDPRQSPTEYLAKYPVESIEVPDNFLPAYPYRQAMNIETLRDERIAPYPRTPYAVQVHRREYYAIITHLDAQIGRVLKALDESGLKDKTLVILTSDHGLAVGHHGLIGKQNLYEHSVRVPFVLRGPGIEAGKRITAPIYVQDIAPTTLQIAGKPDNKTNYFRSLAPYLDGSGIPDSRPIYGAYMETQRMVSADGYKLIYYPTVGVARLYHIADDPSETKDLLADGGGTPEARERAMQLFRTLVELQKETGDTLILNPLTFKRDP